MIVYREIDLSRTKWTAVGGNWLKRQDSFFHYIRGVSPNSFNLFISNKQIQDGAVEGTVKVHKGGDSSGRLVFRFGPNGCYYAGVGGYGRQYAIVKQVRERHQIVSVGLALSGSVQDIKYNKPYTIRVEFVGDKITLKSSGVTVLEASDNWFKEGHIGFDTYGRTRVEFSDYHAYEVPPIGHIVKVLESFPYSLKRELNCLNRELIDENDVQRVLWAILRSHYGDLVDEEILGKFGLKHYRNDFGIPSLATIIEVKVISKSTRLKAVQESLMIDAVGYFKTMTNYRHLIFFIYNKANKFIDSTFTNALRSLDPVAAVVIVPGIKAG
ncbi:MAG TPA: hypothetical protein VIH42_01940 [Thermoguttaceae bacterium]